MTKNKMLSILCIVFCLKSEASIFNCFAHYCDLPYNTRGVLDGIEKCYDRPDRKVLVREITWKENRRHGPARCWEQGVLKQDVIYVGGQEHGVVIDYRFDSRGHRMSFATDGKISGPRVMVNDKLEINDFMGCWANDHFVSLDSNLCRNQKMFGKEKDVLAFIAKTQKEEFESKNGKFQKKNDSGVMTEDVTLRDGRRDGAYKAFYDSGKRRIEGTYKLGEKIGKWTYYFESGKVSLVEFFTSDSFMEYTQYYENGNPQEKVSLTSKDGNVTRKCQSRYYDTGVISDEGCYLPGSWWMRQDGEWKSWYSHGGLQSVGTYDKDIKKGLWKYYSHENKNQISSEEIYSAGRVIESRDYSADKILVRTFFEDGSLKSQVERPKTQEKEI